MPAAVPYIVAAVVNAAGVALFYVKVAYIVTALLVSGWQSDRARRAANQARDAAGGRERTLNLRSAVAARRTVLGTARIGGPIAYAEFVGTNEEYLDIIIACNHGELFAVVGVYAGDEYIPASAVVSQAPNAGKYNSQARVVRESQSVALAAANTFSLTKAPVTLAGVQVLLSDGASPPGFVPLVVLSVVGTLVTLTAPATGTCEVNYDAYGIAPLKLQWMLGSTSQASTTWAGLSTPKWTATDRLQGVAHVRALMLIDDPVFATGMPEFSLLGQGPKGVYDPRTLTTINYTSNPALLSAWWRTLARVDGGMGVPSTWIDWPSVATAANICDELITVKTLDGSGTQQVKRYECHTVLDLTRPAMENLRIILGAMAGDFPFTAGLYRCYAGAFRAATVTLTDDDIVADKPITFGPSTSGFDKPPNTMTAMFIDAAHAYVDTGAPQVVNAAYVTADGAQEVMEMDLPATTDARQANYLMGVRLEQSRRALAGSLHVGGRGANLALLDTVQFNLTGYSAIAGKTFEIRRRTNAFDGRYGLTLAEVKSTSFALDANAYTPINLGVPTVDTALWSVTSVAGLAAVSSGLAQRLGDGSVVGRAQVSWTLHAQKYVREAGKIELRWRIPEQEWVYAPPTAGDETATYIGPLRDGVRYVIEARAVNGLKAYSKWVGIEHLVVGETVAPANVTGFTVVQIPTGVRFNWAANADTNLLEYEVHEEASWVDATVALWKGRGTNFELSWPVAGSHTYLIKARNNSRVLSATAASATVTVDAGVLITDGTVTDTSTTTGSTGQPGASVVSGVMYGPQIDAAAEHELDFVVNGKHQQTFYREAYSAEVELWLTWSATFGGAETEITSIPRRRFMAGLAPFGSITFFDVPLRALGYKPGAVNRFYNLRYTITLRSSNGTALACAKDFTADANWRVVRRRR